MEETPAQATTGRSRCAEGGVLMWTWKPGPALPWVFRPCSPPESCLWLSHTPPQSLPWGQCSQASLPTAVLGEGPQGSPSLTLV